MPENKTTVATGLAEIHYALLTKDDSTGATYGTPKKLGDAISAKVSPAVNSATLFAENGPLVTANALGEITVEISVADIPFDIQAELLGMTLNADGVLIDNAEDQAPEVALGFKRTTNTGKSRYVWLLKGKFKLPEEEAKTAEGTTAFQTPTMTGTFVKRVSDGNWRYRVDAGAADVKQSVIDNWFKAVYSETPTI